MTNGANVLYVDVNIAAHVLYMLVNYHVICKIESKFFLAVVENYMTLYPN